MPLDEQERAILVQAVLDSFSPKELKIIFKESIDEWVDKQFTKFGRWSFYGLAAAATGVLTYLIAVVQIKSGH